MGNIVRRVRIRLAVPPVTAAPACFAPTAAANVWAAISSAAVNRKPTTRAALLHGLFSVAAHG